MSNDDSPNPETTFHGLLGTSRVVTTEEDERVVVKALDHLAVPDRDEFQRHFESLTRLDHPNLVRYLDLDVDSDPVEITEEYIAGTEFLSYLRRAPDLEEVRTLRRRLAEEGRSTVPEPEEPAEPDESEAEPEEAPAEETSAETGESSGPGTETDGAADSAHQTGPDLDPGDVPEPDDEPENGDASPADQRPELLSETPVPEQHSYSEVELGDESSDVVRDPPEDHD